eukprot:scaffold5318_cov102-Isochrysis_galbana.AAC.2
MGTQCAALPLVLQRPTHPSCARLPQDLVALSFLGPSQARSSNIVAPAVPECLGRCALYPGTPSLASGSGFVLRVPRRAKA